MRLRPLGLAIIVTAGVACGGGTTSNRHLDGGPADGGSSDAGPRQSWNALANKARDVDILFLIDDSSGMRAAQTSLRSSLSTFVDALEALPGGLPNVHIAVVSQDMGAGDGSISGCQNDSNGTMPAGKRGIFQFTGGIIPPATTPCAPHLNVGDTFVSNVGGVANYTGPLVDVLSCLTALGESGCGFEHQFAAILRALGADGGGGAPPENQGFLRSEAGLAIVMLTNEDDCSALAGAPLYDVSTNLTVASLLGPPANFRCNEFGHLCSTGTGPLMGPARMAPNDDMNAMVAYDTCVSNDTDGYLLSTHATADLIKGLKIDPRSQIAVASIQGAPQPYVVHWTAPRATDMSCGKASCPWPEITHSCTAPDASVADPGVRTAQFVQEFGDQGLLLSICDGSFGPSLERVAASIGTLVAPFCLEHSFADDPTKPGLQPDCNATLHQRDATSAFVDTPLPACADNGGAAPCWSLTKDVASCAGSSVHVTQAAGKAMPGDVVTFDCIPCRSDPPDPATCY